MWEALFQFSMAYLDNGGNPAKSVEHIKADVVLMKCSRSGRATCGYDGVTTQFPVSRYIATGL